MQFFEDLKKADLVLGSQSPRRRDLLQMAGLPFRVWVLPAGEEEFPPDMPPEDVSLFLARQKAKPYQTHLTPQTLLITADTIVVKDHQILNKAANPSHARAMLELLSGQVHKVITGVCLSCVGQQHAFSETTLVKFAPLSPEEINHYIDTCQPFDKAGAYGIQEWIGAVGVESIEGSYHNVVGLPVAKLYKELKKFFYEHFQQAHKE